MQTLNDSIAYRVKNNPRMCLLREPAQLEEKLKHLTNRQVWLLQFQDIARWQEKMIHTECDRRQQAYADTCRSLDRPIGWWF